MTMTFKVLSALLSYPDEALQNAAPELKTVLEEEKLLTPDSGLELAELIDEIAGTDIYDLQERYVELFDRTRPLSLHLFEHVYGESRDRGQAMIDLKSMYEENGLRLGAGELPDYLPAFLEFLSMLPMPEARKSLGQPAHILSALAERLEKRGASYAAVFRALEGLAVPTGAADPDNILPENAEDDPNDFAALDAVWEEEEVTFGPGATQSCKDRLVAQIRAGRRPAGAAPSRGGTP
jgi:nitrate reductase molybdenum cofactor assembly chaperone NarJ/NarW